MFRDQVGGVFVPDVATPSSFPGHIAASARLFARVLPAGHDITNVGQYPGGIRGDEDSGTRRLTWIPARRAIQGVASKIRCK